MLINDGKGFFHDVSSKCGDGLTPVESSRGVAAEDFDQDGDIDLIVLNALARPTVIEKCIIAKRALVAVRLTRTLCQPRCDRRSRND